MNETINYLIKEFDKILAGETKADENTNSTLFGAYEASITVHNKYLNFQMKTSSLLLMLARKMESVNSLSRTKKSDCLRL